MTNSAPLILTDESHAVFRLHFCLLLFTFDLTDGRGRDNVVYGPDFVDEVLVLFEREGLRAVGECAFGVVVYFDDESVGSGGHARARERHHHVVVARSVRRVDDDGQVRDASNGGDGREVERVARVLGEGAYAALAEDDVVVALGHYVLGGEKPLVEHRRQPALQEHGHARAPRAAQQREVLHVARADLYHVAVALDQVNAVLVQSFGDYLQAERLAYVCENLHAVFAESLEGVRGGARLERAAAEEARAASADGLRDLERLLAALDGARARDDRHLVAADCGVADLH